MRVEVVHHQGDLLNLWIMHVHQLPDLLRPVAPGTTVRDVDLPLAAERFDEQKHVGCPVTLVLVIDPGCSPRPRRMHRPRLFHQRLAGFIHGNRSPPYVAQNGRGARGAVGEQGLAKVVEDGALLHPQRLHDREDAFGETTTGVARVADALS